MGEAFLMQKGEVVEPEPPIPEGALYWEGDEFAAVTGGWVNGRVRTSVGGIYDFSKENDHIYLYAERPSTSSYYGNTYISVDTQNKIDVTHIDTLIIDWESLTPRGGFFGLSNELDTEDFIVSSFVNDEFSRQENTLDVSGVSGSYHIKIMAATSGNSNDQLISELKIYSVRGE